MRRYFAVQVCFELKWELHEYFRVVCCDFCYSRLSHCLFVYLFVVVVLCCFGWVLFAPNLPKLPKDRKFSEAALVEFLLGRASFPN